ncbi:TPA: glycosyltransferase [Aeromonas veronii]|nr:glycosyltransferase [Aeromonas veronii]
MGVARSKALVLVAAYNGAQWLTEQIDSILNQSGVDIFIVISVDTSTDDTLKLCKKYADSYSNVTVLPYGEYFGGAGKNFYRLVKDCDLSRFDYIAFSDQDDIWYENKLFNAIKSLETYDCYSSNVTAFWQDDRKVLINKAQSQCQWDYLFEAAGPGCTYVLKRDVVLQFKRLLLDNYEHIGSNIALHDWLIYAFSRSQNYRWFIDPEPMMFYRQHENNQVGTNNGIAAAVKRLKLIKCKWYRYQVTQIAELIGLKNSDIYRYGLSNGYIGNIYLLSKVQRLRRRFRDRLALAVALLFNLF